MENRTPIRPQEEIRIVKRINIVPPNGPKAGLTVGLILYERQFNQGYKIAESEEQESSNPLAIYPKQESYPVDSIDALILEAVRVDYPSSFVYNELIFTAADEVRLRNITSRPSEKADLVICPDLSIQNWGRLGIKKLDCFRKEVNVYAHFSLKHINNIAFRGRCSFANHQSIYQSLDEINFL